MFVLITSHVLTHDCISLDLTCWFTYLCILSIVFEHDVCITFHLIVIVCMCAWVIYSVHYLTACRMTALLLLDCMLFVCVGHTSIPLPPTLLVSVIFFILVFTFASVRPCVCLFSDRARGLGVGSSDELYWCTRAFWRRVTLWCRLKSDHWRPV